MKRILFAINQFYRGGAELSLLNFIRLLPPERFHITVIIYDHKERTDAVSLVEKLPADVRLVFRSGCCQTFGQFGDEIGTETYDLAVSVGEWHSPQLVMRHVRAVRKAIWVHADIVSPAIPKASDLFAYNAMVDAWICVSNCQRDLMRARLRFAEDRIFSVHNSIAVDDVRKAAQEQVELPSVCKGRKLIVMTGNLRPAKNYIRAVRTAAKLRNAGVDAVWLVVGGLADGRYVNVVRREMAVCQLEDRFILLGAQENPWRYMAKADAFVSTSDTESWCMAVTEAMALGVPVVATRTDGVAEQIRDGENGYLCRFDETHLTQRLKLVLTDESVRWRICSNIGRGKLPFDPVAEFDAVVCSNPAPRSCGKTLFVIDDANYRGGAHAATTRMLKALHEKGIVCDVFSGIAPSCETLNLFHPVNVRFSPCPSCDRWFDQCGFRDVIFKHDVPLAKKFRKLGLSLARRLTGYRPDVSGVAEVGQDVVSLFGEYECVCVMSEGSVYRKAVSGLPARIRKIQFIHTFYALWREFNSWTRKLIADDERIYLKMDKICLIGEENARSFAKIFPELAGKVAQFHNVIEVSPRGNERSSEGRLVTVARLEAEKDFPRAIEIARRLKAAGCDFRWTVYGDGKSRPEFEAQVARLGLREQFVFAGYDKNPQARMREADLFVLLSHYEGLPNVVYESLIVGTPVFATAVGGIPEQIEAGKTGMLVADDEDAIFEGLREVLDHPERIAEWKRNLKDYRYDNEAVVESFRKLIE